MEDRVSYKPRLLTCWAVPVLQDFWVGSNFGGRRRGHHADRVCAMHEGTCSVFALGLEA